MKNYTQSSRGVHKTAPKGFDLSLGFLFFSNIVVTLFSITQDWNLSTLLWIYWFQSVIIGFFNFIRILALKEFSTERVLINGKSVQPTQRTKYFVAFFFLAHYGLFHLAYLVYFVIDAVVREHGALFTSNGLLYVILSAVLFFANHLFSYFYNKPQDTKKQNIGVLAFYPYVRILPMHLTIFFNFLFGSTVPMFTITKIIADVVMHLVERHALSKGEVDQR